MYNAYCLEEVVSKLPIEALSISNHVKKDILFIGSKPGHLLCCNHIVEGNNNHYEYIVTRNFEKKPVIDLKVIEQMDFIACHTDSNFSIHEATQPYRLVASTTKYKPIFNFTFHIEKKFTFFLLSLKNRLVIIKILNNEIEEMANINLVDTSIKSLWCNNSIFIAMKNEYQFVKLSINCKDPENLIVDKLEPPRNLFPISPYLNENQALLIKLKDKSLVGLCREDKIVDFVDIDTGNLAGINNCRFSDVICKLAYDSPYLIGILNSNIVEIRLISPPMFIQKISMPKVSMLSVGMMGSIYCANEGQAWKLNALTHLEHNFKLLKNEKQFELALQLAQSYQPLIDQNSVIDLKKNIAAHYFLEQKFTKSFGIHIQLNTDILFIINLFNEFVPEKYAPLISRFKEEDLQLYNISQKQIISDRKYAIQALVEYLSTKRNEYSKLVNLHYMDYRDGRNEHILSVNELKRNEASLELIDSVLLKCYIQISPTLVGSLLRSKNCSCIISEAEKDLKNSKMFDELLILYKQKKMYRKFLEFLKREFKKDGTSNKIIEKISSFLMELKQEQFPLIVEFSPIIFSENINLGIKIFTEGKDAKNFDRELVLQYIKRDYPQAVISYLEYIIFNWNDMRPKFHEELLSQYIARVRLLMAAYVKSLAGNNAIISSTDDQQDELTMLRKKLRKFLEQDKNYTIKDALDLIKSNQNLVEEKAVLYGRMGQHLEALNIYINLLMNFDAAEHHCQIYYNEKNGKTSKLFYNLFHFYITGNINPVNIENAGNREQNPQPKRQNLTEALKLLRRHPTKINIVSAFSLIPSDIPLQRICGALKVVFEAFNNRLTSVNMVLSLTNITVRRVELKLNSLKKQRIHINEMVECIICGKKIMDSAFVRRRDFSISHFFCHKTNLERRKQRIDSPLESTQKKQSH